MTIFDKVTQSPEALAMYITDCVAEQLNATPQCRESYIFDGLHKRAYFTILLNVLKSEEVANFNQIDSVTSWFTNLGDVSATTTFDQIRNAMRRDELTNEEA
jgi:hypothetical protein